MTSDGATPASEVYEIVRTPASVVRRLTRASTVFVAFFLSPGSDPGSPSGPTVSVIEKATRSEVLSFAEERDDDGQGTVSSLQADLANSSADAFARKWLH